VSKTKQKSTPKRYSYNEERGDNTGHYHRAQKSTHRSRDWNRLDSALRTGDWKQVARTLGE
jgi:hypothetical protein